MGRVGCFVCMSVVFLGVSGPFEAASFDGRVIWTSLGI